MSVRIGSNIISQKAQRQLTQSDAQLATVFERLSSGQRINRAKDDVAGLAVADHLRKDGRVFTQGVNNFNNGVSLLNIADGALEELTNIVVRIKELAEQSANGTLSNRQRASLNTEAQALKNEYFRISRSSEFNNSNLFDGSVSNLRFQGGYGSDGGVSSSIGGVMGDGTFGGMTTYIDDGVLYSTTGEDVTLGDLNGDGILDMVTAFTVSIFGLPSGRVAVRLGVGDGTFRASTTYAIGPAVSSEVALADLNNDGILDIVASGGTFSSEGAYTIRLGRGDGTFGNSINYSADNIQKDLALGDINNDGILDMVSTGVTDGTGATYVRLGLGDGTFQNATTYTAESWESNAIALSDVNRDGLLDLITVGADGLNGRATIRFGNGNGTFGSATSYITDITRSNDVVLEDLNKDGILDLITAGLGNGPSSMTVRMGNSNGTFGPASSYASGNGDREEFQIADVNGDGNLDVVLLGSTASLEHEIDIKLGRGDGTFYNGVSYIASSLRLSTGIAVGDLNQDGVVDYVTSSQISSYYSTSSVFLGNTRSGVAPLLEFSLKNVTDSKSALSLMSQKLNHLTAQRSTIGAFQSRLNSALVALQSQAENSRVAESRIRNADIASEAANATRLSILRDSAQAVLAQANQLPALALKLFEVDATS
jgi:flagellin